MPYTPTPNELRRLNFRTDSPAQPFPTRAYYTELPNGNYLVLTPLPGMKTATEMTEKNVKVARHTIDSIDDLERSLAGQGKRQRL